MMRLFVLAVAAIASLAALPAPMPAQAPAPTGADETQIRRIVGTTLADRINAADAKGVAALWSETGTHSGLVYGARVREGRASIEQMWAAGFSQPGRDAARKVTVAISAVRFVRPDVAVVDAQNTYHGGQGAGGTPKADTGELLFVVLSRESGAWIITASRVVPLIGQPPR
jgi:uncharacterized protein (TIGR02246 family)